MFNSYSGKYEDFETMIDRKKAIDNQLIPKLAVQDMLKRK